MSHRHRPNKAHFPTVMAQTVIALALIAFMLAGCSNWTGVRPQIEATHSPVARPDATATAQEIPTLIPIVTVVPSLKPDVPMLAEWVEYTEREDPHILKAIELLRSKGSR